MVKSLRGLKDSSGVVVIGANALLENAGTIATLRKIKEANVNLQVKVWAENEEVMNKLKAMGIEEVAEIMSSTGFEDVVRALDAIDIKDERIVLINSDKDLEIIKHVSFPGNALEYLASLGLRTINVKAPNAKEANLNSMPLVITRAIAGIFKDEPSIRNSYQQLARSYGENEQIQVEDLKKINDLALKLVEIPLIIVSEELDQEAIQAQIIYEETSGEI